MHKTTSVTDGDTMKRIQWLLLSVLSFNVLLVYILINSKFSYVNNGENIVKAIPIGYWLLLGIVSLLFVLTIFRHKNLTFAAAVLYGFLFYVTNLYFIIPYEQTDTPSRIIEFMLSSGKITHKAISNPNLSYLSYPISFILETVMMLVGGIGKVSIYTVGLFTFISIFYIGLVFFYYYKHNQNRMLAGISLATYIILSFYVINDQVAPQTLALVYLPYLYKITFDSMESEENLKTLALILIFWFALVFTHPFMFLFYLLPILGIMVYMHSFSRKKIINLSTVGILVSIWGLGFVLLFYNTFSIPLRLLVERWGEVMGGSWVTIANFFGKRGEIGSIKYVPHLHYELIPQWAVKLQALSIRILLILMITITAYGFILHLRKVIKKQEPPLQLVFDLSVLVSSGISFVLGLFTIFLGQRALQIAFIPVSHYIHQNKKKFIVYTLTGILVIAPVVFTLNVLINATVTSPVTIREIQTLNGGKFLDYSLYYSPSPTPIVFVCTRELYPAKHRTLDIVTWIALGRPGSVSNFRYIMWSKKAKLSVEYYGVEQIFINELTKRNIIYNNEFTKIYE